MPVIWIKPAAPTAAHSAAYAEKCAAKLIKNHEHRAKSLAAAYQRSIPKGKRAMGRALRTYKTAYCTRVAAVAEANRRRRLCDRISSTEVLKHAETLRIGENIFEPIRLILQPKSKGGYRPIWDPGLERRAVAIALTPILKAHLAKAKFQSPSVEYAVKIVIGAILAGNRYAVRLDIKKHFGSFEFKKLLTLLPLPKAMVANGVLMRGLPDHLIQGEHLPAMVKEARQGLIQGLPLSPMVAAMSVSKLIWAFEDVIVVNYADDFIVIGQSEDLVKARAEALCSAISQLPGGQFSAKREPPKHIIDGWDFLGHAFRKEGGKLKIRPTIVNEQKYEKTIHELESKIPHNQTPFAHINCGKKELQIAIGALSDMWVYARSWARAFRACNEASLMREATKAIIQTYLDQFGLDFAALAKHGNPEAAWSWIGYSD